MSARRQLSTSSREDFLRESPRQVLGLDPERQGNYSKLLKEGDLWWNLAWLMELNLCNYFGGNPEKLEKIRVEEFVLALEKYKKARMAYKTNYVEKQIRAIEMKLDAETLVDLGRKYDASDFESCYRAMQRLEKATTLFGACLKIDGGRSLAWFKRSESLHMKLCQRLAELSEMEARKKWKFVVA